MGFLTARASFELGELAFADGRMEEARAHYSTALRYWDRDGAATASFRRRAIARLEELGLP
jgi:hypothetical protein